MNTKTSKKLVRSLFISFMPKPSTMGVADLHVTVTVTRKASRKNSKEVRREYVLRKGSRSINRIQDLYSDDKLTLGYMHMPVYPTVSFNRNYGKEF